MQIEPHEPGRSEVAEPCDLCGQQPTQENPVHDIGLYACAACIEYAHFRAQVPEQTET